MGHVLARSLALVAFLAAAACGQPDEVFAVGGASAFTADTTRMTIVADAPSSDPARTGVDAWRLALIQKDGIDLPFVVALGSKGGDEVMDIVVAADADDKTNVRIVTKRQVANPDALGDALAEDLDKLTDDVAGKDCDLDAVWERVREGRELLKKKSADYSCDTAPLSIGGERSVCNKVLGALIGTVGDRWEEDGELKSCLK